MPPMHRRPVLRSAGPPESFRREPARVKHTVARAVWTAASGRCRTSCSTSASEALRRGSRRSSSDIAESSVRRISARWPETNRSVSASKASHDEIVATAARRVPIAPFARSPIATTLGSESARQGGEPSAPKRTSQAALPAVRVRSIHDAKIGELPRVTSPSHIHVVDPRRRRPMMRPRYNLFDGFLFALGHHLDAPIGPILHPAGDSQPPRLPLRRCTKEYAGHPPPHDELNSFGRHLPSLFPGRSRVGCAPNPHFAVPNPPPSSNYHAARGSFVPLRRWAARTVARTRRARRRVEDE